MSLNINGVYPNRIQVNEDGKITDLSRLRIYKDDEVFFNWQKPYVLTISKGSHSSVTVGVKTTAGSMIVGQVTNGDTIYHGYYLEIMVTGNSGYKVTWKINGVTQTSTRVTIPVNGNVNISVTETADLTPLSKPSISGTFTFDSYGGFYYLILQINNPNPRSVNASILVYSNGDHLDGSVEMVIGANATENYGYGEMFSVGAKVQVTFSCAGYADSVSYTTFGQYKGDSTDETTTTTTTTTTR